MSFEAISDICNRIRFVVIMQGHVETDEHGVGGAAAGGVKVDPPG